MVRGGVGRGGGGCRAFGLLLGMLLAARVVAGVSEVPLRSAANTFAFDLASGTLAAVDATASEVTLYKRAYFDGDRSAVAGPVRVGKLAGKPVFKQLAGGENFLVVPCFGEAKMHVLDADDLSAVGAVGLVSAENICVTSSSDAEDPIVFYTFRHRGRYRLGRVDLSTLEDLGELEVGRDPVQVRISDDGGLLYVGNDVIYERRRRPGEQPLLTPVPDTFCPRSPVVDPFTQLVPVGGGRLRRFGDAESLPDFKFRVAAFHPALPLLLGVRGKELITVSTNTLAERQRIELPFGDWGYNDRRFEEMELPSTVLESRFDVHLECFFDLEQRRVIVVKEGERAAVIPDRELDPKPEPRLMVKAQAPTKLVVGEMVHIPVSPVGVAEGEVDVALVRAPYGVEFDGQRLTWRPSRAAVGTAEIVFEIAAAGLSRHQLLRLPVMHPSIELGFKPGRMVLSPDGKHLVAWGSQQGQLQMVLLDAEAMEVIGRCTVEGRPSPPAVATSGGHVYVAAGEKWNELAVRTGPGLAEQKRIPLDEPISRMQLLPDARFLAVSARSLRLFSIPDLEPAAQGAIHPILTADARTRLRLSSESVSQRPLVEQVGDTLILDHYGFSPDLRSIRCLSAKRFPASSDRYQKPYSLPTRWGRRLDWTGLARPIDRLRRSVDDEFEILGKLGTASLLDAHPIAVALDGGGRDSVRGGRATAALRFHEIVNGDPYLTAGLATQIPVSTGRWDPTPPVSSRDQIFVLQHNRIFRFSIDARDFAGAPEPLRFLPEQSAIHIPGSGETVLEHQVAGGVAPLRYSLRSEYGGLVIDPDSGAIVVDGESFVARVAREGFKYDPVAAAMLDDYRDGDLAGKLEKSEYLSPVFERLMGRAPQGIPVSVPVTVRAQDAAGEIAHLSYVVLVELPAEIRDRYQKRRESDRGQPVDGRMDEGQDGGGDEPASGGLWGWIAVALLAAWTLILAKIWIGKVARAPRRRAPKQEVPPAESPARGRPEDPY